MSKIFAFLAPNFSMIIVGLVLAAAGGLYALQASKLTTAQKDLSVAKVSLASANQLAAERAEAVATLTREASEKARAFEKQLTKAVQENNDEQDLNQRKISQLSAALVAAQRVRAPTINAYATASGSRSGGTASDPAPGVSFEARASKLGLLLETCRSEVDNDAGELEQLAEQTRGLQSHIQVIESGYGSFWGSKGEHK